MDKIIKLRYNDGEQLLVNVSHILLITESINGFRSVNLTNGTTVHVKETIDEIYRQINRPFM